MAITGTGLWTRTGPATSVDDRDYFSGILAISNTAYAEAQTYKFGFSAPEVHIINTSATQLVFQWLSRSGQAVDSGVVPGNTSFVLRHANKQGVLLRVEAGSSTCHVIAVG